MVWLSVQFLTGNPLTTAARDVEASDIDVLSSSHNTCGHDLVPSSESYYKNDSPSPPKLLSLTIKSICCPTGQSKTFSTNCCSSSVSTSASPSSRRRLMGRMSVQSVRGCCLQYSTPHSDITNDFLSKLHVGSTRLVL